MREIGIICNERQVLAIQVGATQLRRPAKKQPHPDFLARGLCNAVVQDDGRIRWFMADGLSESPRERSPFGLPGDRLYVRETWCVGRVVCADVMEGEPEELFVSQCRGETDVIYRAQCVKHSVTTEDAIWRPSIHMPKRFSRITLLVKRVWIERVDLISTADCIAVNIQPAQPSTSEDLWEYYSDTFESPFIEYWDETYSNPKLPLDQEDPMLYESGPWAWAVEFEVEK